MGGPWEGHTLGDLGKLLKEPKASLTGQPTPEDPRCPLKTPPRTLPQTRVGGGCYPHSISCGDTLPGQAGVSSGHWWTVAVTVSIPIPRSLCLPQGAPTELLLRTDLIAWAAYCPLQATGCGKWHVSLPSLPRASALQVLVRDLSFCFQVPYQVPRVPGFQHRSP